MAMRILMFQGITQKMSRGLGAVLRDPNNGVRGNGTFAYKAI